MTMALKEKHARGKEELVSFGLFFLGASEFTLTEAA